VGEFYRPSDYYTYAVFSMQHVHQNTYRLHAIVLSRSPLLAHLMSTSPQTGAQRVIHVQLEHEPEVSQEVRVSFLTLFPATECGAEIRWASKTQTPVISSTVVISYRIQLPSSEAVPGGTSHLETAGADRIIIITGFCYRYASLCSPHVFTCVYFRYFQL